MNVIRTCVATRERREQKDMFRVVKYNGQISVDLTYKAHGRGAYISKDANAIQLAKKNKIFNKIFECEVSDEIYDQLLSILERGGKNGKK